MNPKTILLKNFRGLPVWGWLLILLVLFLIMRYVRARRAAADDFVAEEPAGDYPIIPSAPSGGINAPGDGEMSFDDWQSAFDTVFGEVQGELQNLGSTITDSITGSEDSVRGSQIAAVEEIVDAMEEREEADRRSAAEIAETQSDIVEAISGIPTPTVTTKTIIKKPARPKPAQKKAVRVAKQRGVIKQAKQGKVTKKERKQIATAKKKIKQIRKPKP